MSKMLSKMNLISVVQQMPKEDIETIQGYVEMIEEENQQLKKQLEETNEMIEKCGFVNIEQVMLNYCGLIAQQKEFIKWLEDKIYSIEPKGTGINYNCEYDSEEDYVMAMQEQSRLNTLKEILQKCKSIIGVSDEKK